MFPIASMSCFLLQGGLVFPIASMSMFPIAGRTSVSYC